MQLETNSEIICVDEDLFYSKCFTKLNNNLLNASYWNDLSSSLE